MKSILVSIERILELMDNKYLFRICFQSFYSSLPLPIFSMFSLNRFQVIVHFSLIPCTFCLEMPFFVLLSPAKLSILLHCVRNNLTMVYGLICSQALSCQNRQFNSFSPFHFLSINNDTIFLQSLISILMCIPFFSHRLVLFPVFHMFQRVPVPTFLLKTVAYFLFSVFFLSFSIFRLYQFCFWLFTSIAIRQFINHFGV